MAESLQLTIPAGENEVSIEIEILDNGIVEGDEYFLVGLSTTDASLTVATSSANVTILEDDSK